MNQTLNKSSNQQDSFDVFYVDDDDKDLSIKKVKAIEPNNDILFIYSNELQNIYNLNIKEFSYVIFEEDLNRLNDAEFEYFWQKFFLPWLEKIDENYLSINLDYFKFQLGSTLEKRYLIKKIIHFIMYIFPYLILKKICQKYNISTFDSIINILSDMYQNEPKTFKKLLIKELDNITQYSNNFLNSIGSVVKSSKKNTIDNVIDILQDQISKQNEYNQIFKDIIDETINDNLYKLANDLLVNDFENIAFD